MSDEKSDPITDAIDDLPLPDPNARSQRPAKRPYFKKSPQRRAKLASVEGSLSLTGEQFAELLAAIANQQAAGHTSPTLELAVKAIEQLKTEVGRTVTRSNAQHPGVSAFSYPEGDVAAAAAGKVKKLRYETYFCGQREREDSLTPIEVDLYNQFEASKTCRDGRWTATLKKNGSRTELWISVPALTNDDRMNLPPLVTILGELLYGAETVDPNETMAQILKMQTQIKELQSQISATPSEAVVR